MFFQKWLENCWYKLSWEKFFISEFPVLPYTSIENSAKSVFNIMFILSTGNDKVINSADQIKISETIICFIFWPVKEHPQTPSTQNLLHDLTSHCSNDWRSLNFTTIESMITFGESMCHENLFAYLPILLY